MFTHQWSLKGTVLSGRFQPPRGERPGVYQSPTLRLEYRSVERRHGVEFQSPFLSRHGDRITGKVRLGRTNRWVRIANRGTDTEGVTMQVVRAGFLRRKQVLVAPNGAAVATVHRKGGHFDVDIPAATFVPEKGRGGHGKARLFEAAIAMLLAAQIDVELGRRNAVAGAAAGAAGAAAAGATARAVHKRRKGPDGEGT